MVYTLHLSDWRTIIVVLLVAIGMTSSQLGESNVGFEKPTGIMEDITYDGEAGSDDAIAEEDESSVHSVQLGGKYRPADETFLMCLRRTSIKDQVIYLNLTQIIDWEFYKSKPSEISACFYFCKSKEPTDFISIQSSYGQNTQSCGCHHRNQIDVEEAESNYYCDSTPGYHKIYCGPTNMDCLNRSNGKLSSVLTLLFCLSITLMFKNR